MSLYVQHDIQIARWAAAKARFTVAGGAQSRSGIDAGGDA
jgi:hypothetical protein